MEDIDFPSGNELSPFPENAFAYSDFGTIYVLFHQLKPYKLKNPAKLLWTKLLSSVSNLSPVCAKPENIFPGYIATSIYLKGNMSIWLGQLTQSLMISSMTMKIYKKYIFIVVNIISKVP